MTSWTEAEVRGRKQAVANAWRHAADIAEEGRRRADKIAADYRAAAEAHEAEADEAKTTEAAIRAAAAEATGRVAAEATEVAEVIKSEMRATAREVATAILK